MARQRASTFGSVRKLRSGRQQASYWHEGKRHIADHTFDTKADADAWLATIRTDIGRGGWIDPRRVASRLPNSARNGSKATHPSAAVP